MYDVKEGGVWRTCTGLGAPRKGGERSSSGGVNSFRRRFAALTSSWFGDDKCRHPNPTFCASLIKLVTHSCRLSPTAPATIIAISKRLTTPSQNNLFSASPLRPPGPIITSYKLARREASVWRRSQCRGTRLKGIELMCCCAKVRKL